jgi:hypothetical protein
VSHVGPTVRKYVVRTKKSILRMRTPVVSTATAAAVIAMVSMLPAGGAAASAGSHAADLKPAPARIRLDADSDSATNPMECLYYLETCLGESGAYLGADDVTAAATVSLAITAWIALIKSGTVDKGADDGDEEVEIENEGAENSDGPDDDLFGYMFTQSGGNPVWSDDGCASGAQQTSCTWILVPTGASYALENAYYYYKGDHYYATAAGSESGADIILEAAQSGGEDYRTWYYDNPDIAGPIQTPTPAPTSSSSPSPTPTP